MKQLIGPQNKTLIQIAQDFGIDVSNQQWINNHFWSTPVSQMCTRVFPSGFCNYDYGIYGGETPLNLLDLMA